VKRYVFILLAFAFALILFGCKKDMRAAYHAPIDFRDLTPAVNCGVGSTIKPTNLSPGGEETISDPSPDLTWDFSGCDVWMFTVNLSDEAGNYIGNVVHEHLIETENSFSSDTDYLDDCTTYYWYVIGYGSADYFSDVASFHTDFTGSCPPVEDCTGAPPLPIPIAPKSEMLEISNPQLLWVDSDPGCAVENYHYEVAHSPDFSDIILEGDTTLHSYDPTTSYLSDDCTNYFWRVTAEANGFTRTSDVVQFGTAFTGGCMHYICQGSQLEPPVLVLPEEGTTITDPSPQFLWDYDLDTCWPDYFEVYVSKLPDLSVSLFHLNTGRKLSWTPLSDGNFSNCTKYYWAVYAIQGQRATIVPSATGTFYTNFGDTICGLVERPNIPIEYVHDFHLGCVSGSQMWALYDFIGPVLGEYEVHIGNRVWPCMLNQGTNYELLCYGALAQAETKLPVELFLKGVDEPVLTLEDTTPFCANVVVCQPPAEGCPRIIVGYQLTNKQPIYASTHWDQSQCQCVP
jgi:hypothetical protein